MPTDDPMPAEIVEPKLSAGQLLRVACGFWTGKARWVAWGLTAACLLAIGANVAVQLGLNVWNKEFFDALEKKNTGVVVSLLLPFILLVVASMGMAVAIVLLRMRLQLSWRLWLSSFLVDCWLTEQRFYRLNIVAPNVDYPEARITEDARQVVELAVDFFAGLLNACLMLAAFIGVLWVSSGAVSVAGTQVPGLMVIVAIIYAAVVSFGIHWLGRPLIARIQQRSSSEATLRATLATTRENAESIALLGGAGDENTSITERLHELAACWRSVINRYGVMTVLTSLNSSAAPLVPLIIMAPGYLEGRVSLGAVTQTAAAFVQVQLAMSWLVDNYARVADWLAAIERVNQLWISFGKLDESLDNADDRISIDESPDERIRLEALSVANHGGKIMIAESDTSIAAGEKVLLTGKSGIGKSTLLRALAGLWPWGSGSILLPRAAKVAFVPQRPYIKAGTLRDVLTFGTDSEAAISDEALGKALERCGLRRMAARLADTEDWRNLLSPGEQQRIAFARLLLHRPDIVVMDEATAALDTDAQDSLMSLFRDELKSCTVISVGHRQELKEYHEREINLVRGRRGTRLGSEEPVHPSVAAARQVRLRVKAATE